MAHKMPPGVDGDHSLVDWVGLSKKRCARCAAGRISVHFGVAVSADMLSKSAVLFNGMQRSNCAGFSALC